ncbi:unnamed protein product [Bursaphelenchus xylophilus]|uniref:(pine wood nematode) hypothetical protein n=1 Tax=Bursaphelenchus xylophilus TaxID=6326 RepID=A0A1I7SR76_BURXY|nr:unnamed protein product [Bursaphelenchus xylophilus]CAG9110940.1 unnamed protein product [Bursaphelenchus xylophilus]
MIQLILYFIFNFLGFLVFYKLWLLLDKPEPYDYTTIPGLKCKELGMKRADIQLAVKKGQRINELSDSVGNLADIKEHSTVSDFLNYLNVTFGALSAFYWGPRYVVTITDKHTLEQLRAHREHLVPLNYFAFASVLLNDENLLDVSKANEVNLSYQHALFHNYNSLCDSETVLSVTKKRLEVYDNIIVLMFDIEIELNAHPIPENIPLLCDMALILQNCPKSEVEWFEDFLRIPN